MNAIKLYVLIIDIMVTNMLMLLSSLVNDVNKISDNESLTFDSDQVAS